MYKKLKKISKSVFVRILLFSIVLNTRNFSSLDNIRARNPPFLETTSPRFYFSNHASSMKNSIYFQMAEKRESIVSVTKNPNESVASQNVISS